MVKLLFLTKVLSKNDHQSYSRHIPISLKFSLFKIMFSARALKWHLCFRLYSHLKYILFHSCVLCVFLVRHFEFTRAVGGHSIIHMLVLVSFEFQIARAQAEMAWISEKRGLELEKLRDKFLSPILVEHFTLRCVHWIQICKY